MKVTITTSTGPHIVNCYGTFYVNLDGTDVMFCFTDAPNRDALEVTEYQSGLKFPIDINEPSGDTLGLDCPMAPDDPYFVTLTRFASRLIDQTIIDRGIPRWRMLELIQMNQRKHKANEIDF